MTTLDPSTAQALDLTAPATRTPSSALRARRAFLVAAPVLAGLFAVVGACADPAAGIMDDSLYKIYADNPGPLPVSYTHLTLPTILLV